jgi:hypothetical protein
MSITEDVGKRPGVTRASSMSKPVVLQQFTLDL